MDAPAGLLAPERDPQTGRREPAARAAKHGLARPGKRTRHDHAPRRPASRSSRGAGRAIAAAVAAAAIAAAITITSVALASSRPANSLVHPTPTVVSAATSPRGSTSGGSVSATTATRGNISSSGTSAGGTRGGASAGGTSAGGTSATALAPVIALVNPSMAAPSGEVTLSGENFGEKPGYVKLTGRPGTGGAFVPLQRDWSNNSIVFSFGGLALGLYSVAVVTAGGAQSPPQNLCIALPFTFPLGCPS